MVMDSLELQASAGMHARALDPFIMLMADMILDSLFVM